MIMRTDPTLKSPFLYWSPTATVHKLKQAVMATQQQQSCSRSGLNNQQKQLHQNLLQERTDM